MANGLLIHFLWTFYVLYSIYEHTRINNPLYKYQVLIPSNVSSLAPQSMITSIKHCLAKYPQHLVSSLLSHWVLSSCCCLCTIQDLALLKLHIVEDWDLHLSRHTLTQPKLMYIQEVKAAH